MEDTQGMIFCVNSQKFEDLNKDGPRECGNWLSYLYFAVFILVIRITMLNLFIAVVLEGFSTTYKELTNTVRSDHFNQLIEIWLDYDPKGTGWIGIEALILLVYRLEEPLGLKGNFEM